jgi:outer membrane immunogenic protein
MKTVLLVYGAFAALGVVSASAADMAVKAPPTVAPIYNWTGFYVGVSGGGIWSDPYLAVNVSGPAGPNSTPAQALVAQQLGNRNNSSWLAGGQAGYNWQMNDFVLGVEADISGTDINNAQSVTSTTVIGRGPKDITTTGSQRLDYFGTVRARFGYAGASGLLVYGTGGFAYGGERASFGVASASGFGAGLVPFNLVASDSSVRTGWTAGVGAEMALMAFGPNWSLRGEYLYYDLGHDLLTVSHPLVPPPGLTATMDSTFRGGLIRVGLDYRFGGPLVARY